MNNIFGGFQIIESVNAVEQDGTEDKEVQVDRGGFWERLFDTDPTLPLWQKTTTKVIQVPRYVPVIFRVLDKFIVHPSLVPKIREALKKEGKSDVFHFE